MNSKDIDALEKKFNLLDKDGSGEIDFDEVGELTECLGVKLSKEQLMDMFREVDIDGSGSLSFEEFKIAMLSSHGDAESKLKIAFSIFDENNDGKIGVDDLLPVMSKFGLEKKEIEEMFKQIDTDGSMSLNFKEFCRLMPEEKKSIKSVKPKSQEKTKEPVEKNTFDRNLKSASKEEKTKHTAKTTSGTSILQIQIGLFRLIQGAAYRCFRESYSANHETHVRAKSLPYCFPSFVKFVKNAIELYKFLGYVNAKCNPVLDELVKSVENEERRLNDRISNWKSLKKTAEMIAEDENMKEMRKTKHDLKIKFAAGVDFAITMKKNKLKLCNVFEGVLAVEELNRLRKLEIEAEEEALNEDGGESAATSDYLKKWNKVLIADAFEEIDGAMIPVSYWYQDFMPKLLSAFSVTSESDIKENIEPNVKDLDLWFKKNMENKRFHRFANDIIENFGQCSAAQKLMVKQGWRLARHYLNGVQKKREREEFGRHDGDLSNYIAFIDVYLKRSYVQNAQMRVSFPYYIGPPVWRFFHTTAEFVCSKPIELQQSCIPTFRMFFKLFAAMYPCPYCRHHLNSAVIQNKEIDMYPMEYILLGKRSDQIDLEIPMEAKLSTVTDGKTMRLFFWKLHNTVNSSIARSEKWYHKRDKPFYTSRFWPSLESEITRMTIIKESHIELQRVRMYYSLLKPCVKLAGLRSELQRVLASKDEKDLQILYRVANKAIKEVEEIVEETNFLQEAYTFNPNASDSIPSFTMEDELFARSGYFTLN